VVFTVYLPYVHPRKRYALPEIDDIVQERFVGDRSYPAMERSYPCPARSTQHSWCSGFRAAAPQWLPGFTAWLAERKPTTLIRPITQDAAVALLVMVVLAQSVWQPPTETAEQLLVPLWRLGGGVQGWGVLLPPTRSRKVVRGPTCQLL
jgi:hypothetical protein